VSWSAVRVFLLLLLLLRASIPSHDREFVNAVCVYIYESERYVI